MMTQVLKKSNVQKLTKSKEKFKSVSNLLLSEESLTVEHRPSLLMVDML